MKLFKTSILELMARPLNYIPFVKAKWKGKFREPAIYEHIFAPVVFAAFIEPLHFWHLNWILVGVYGFFHVFVKEFIVDRNTYAVVDWLNVIERSYGMLLAVQILMF